MSVRVLQALLEHRQAENEDNEANELVDVSIVQLAALDAWPRTAANCLLETEIWRGYRRKLKADTYGSLLLLTMKQ